jgi:arginyl-tRNA synthetase
VFYVQYAHARCCSVLRSYHNVILGPEPIIEQVDDVKINPRVNAENDANLKLLGEQEIALIKKLIEYPRIVELAANHYEPHRIAFYLQELAAEFHSLWATGGKFITDDKELSAARVALVKAVKIVIRNGLEIFGVTAPQEMR